MTPQPSVELGAAARGGAISLVGSVASAGLGFLLIVVLARLLGVSGSGVVLQAIAVFSITMAVTRLGADTTAMWLLPRLLHEDVRRIPAGLLAVLLPPLVVSLVVALAWLVLAGLAGPILGAEVDRAVTAMAWFLPAGALMTVVLAATRAFGGVVPFTVVQNIAVPAGRVVAVPVAVGLGGAAVLASGVWAAVYVPALVAAVVVLGRMVGRALPNGPSLLARPDAALFRRALGFGLPRTVSATAEQANLWLAVILVGVVADAAAAGAYGSAARFVSAGMIVATAVRIAVAPRFSTLLAQQRPDEVQSLYSVSARWVLLFGSPIYVVLAVNAPTVLSWLGEGFDEAAPAMIILCLGSIVLLAAGNVQSLLLMSGGAGWAALNKSIAVAVLVVGTLVLVPELGIEGAAIAWTAATVLDTVLAAVQVRRTTGIAVGPLQILALLGVVGAAVAAPSLVAVWLWGAGVVALLVGTGAAGVGVLLVCWIGRAPLHVAALTGILRR